MNSLAEVGGRRVPGRRWGGWARTREPLGWSVLLAVLLGWGLAGLVSQPEAQTQNGPPLVRASSMAVLPAVQVDPCPFSG